MAGITLHCDNVHSATSVSNIFIDEYMSAANGEFVKIYLYLLRLMNGPDTDFSISSIADKFDHTEKDVLRALGYWERMHLLRLEYDESESLSGICLLDTVSGKSAGEGHTTVPFPRTQAGTGTVLTENSGSGPAFIPASLPSGVPAAAEPQGKRPAEDLTSAMPVPAVQQGGKNAESLASAMPVPAVQQELVSVEEPPAAMYPARREYSADDIRMFRQEESIAELFFISERYLGRTLNATDINTLLYLYDGLRFSTDLIEYLVESCVSNGHTSIRYIEKTALGWADDQITTVEEAKQQTTVHNQTCFMVMKAFGISGRKLVPSETALIRKWTTEYSFSDDLIADACQRTMQTVHQPSFQYVDSILRSWHRYRVRSLADVAQLDAAFQNRKKSTPTAASPSANTAGNSSKNKFNNFKQRSYDYDQLEKMLLTTNAQ